MTKAQQEKTDMIKEVVSKIPFNRRHWTEEEIAEKRAWFEAEISYVYHLGRLHQWKMNPEP
tara:strand:+ start:17487 stop:17669 length:183 start_codon:yes stop_codon:yes gene_type:complete